MWTQAGALLLLACCLWSAEAQRQSIWDDPIKFLTKDKDKCTMVITGHGEYTRLRLSCQGRRRSYWCEYLGKPYTCSAYNKQPRHYFVQMMWGFRKLHNACQGPRQIRPHMCRKATDESQMVFTSASFSQPGSNPSGTGVRPAPHPVRPQPRPVPTRQTSRVQPRVKIPQKIRPQPTTPPVEPHSKRIARLYCWRSLQGICSYVIRWFRY